MKTRIPSTFIVIICHLLLLIYFTYDRKKKKVVYRPLKISPTYFIFVVIISLIAEVFGEEEDGFKSTFLFFYKMI